MDERTLEKLRRLGHEIGPAGVSQDGKMLISIDGRMLTYPEIDKLLADHLRKGNS